MSKNKPLLSAEEQIEHMKSKGIEFSLFDEAQALQYLQFNCYFYKIYAYRKNYPKYQAGPNEGLYIGLDFAYLVDLAEIDMKLRQLLLIMTLDVEHYAKLKLLRYAEENNEDGQCIYHEFVEWLRNLDSKRDTSFSDYNAFMNEVKRSSSSTYTKNIYSHLDLNKIPLWTLIEIVPFGRFLSIYRFVGNKYQNKEMQSDFYLLLSCKEIRNAASHSSCILNELQANTKVHEPSFDMVNELKTKTNISNNIINKKMSNERIREITTVFYTHRRLVTSNSVNASVCRKAEMLKRRIEKNCIFYEENDLIASNLQFICEVLDSWY